MKREELEKRSWWNYLEEDIQELFLTSCLLLKEFENKKYLSEGERIDDFSFIVFPASKAYEGLLKKVFYDMHFIGDKEFYGDRFRIGKALNPSLPKKYEKESVYRKVSEFCGGETLAKNLWETWKSCRNLLFHWFPNERRVISYSEAVECIDEIVNSVDMLFAECKNRLGD